jgi:hypothetical protein
MNGMALILGGAFVLMSVPALAADSLPNQQPTVQAQEHRLESREKALAMMSNKKLGAVRQAEITRQRHEINDLIRRLEAGDQVAPSEVDRAVRAH